MNEIIESSSTVPMVQSERPVIASKVAHYTWRTGKTFFLSKRQTLIAETYLETQNVSECVRAYRREFGKSIGYASAWRLLRLPMVAEYMAEKMEERGKFAGWDKPHFFSVLSDHLRANAEYEQAREDLRHYTGILAKNPKDVEAMIGEGKARKAMLDASKKRLANGDLYGMNLIGKYKGWDMSVGTTFNQEIRIVQQNGRE